jgi:cytochrome b subunit of formate dehydrogenase
MMTQAHTLRGKPDIGRPLLHAIHAITFFALLGSGLLLFVPGLRALATGGYSLAIVRLHRWAGVASVALPLVLLLYLGGPAALAPPRARTLRDSLKGLHQAVTIAMTLAFAATGFVLWPRHPISESLEAGSRLLHEWMTYAAAGLLAVHVLDVTLIEAVVQRMDNRACRGPADAP